MLNKVIIAGRITKDPELRTTTSGKEVCTVSIAVDRDFKTKDGEKETDFITVVAWRNTAVFLSKYFTKGRMAIVDGKLQTRSYEDKDGKKRVAVEVVADNVYFGDSKNDKGGEKVSYDTEPAHGGVSVEFDEIDEDDDLLPF